MIQMYPLNPVICNDANFASAYNAAESSVFMGSQCLSEESVNSMLDQGAKFNFILCMDDEVEMMQHLAHLGGLDAETQPKVERYQTSANKSYDEMISDLHGIIRGNLFEEGMG